MMLLSRLGMRWQYLPSITFLQTAIITYTYYVFVCGLHKGHFLYTVEHLNATQKKSSECPSC